jgi:hypothetical protein
MTKRKLEKEKPAPAKTASDFAPPAPPAPQETQIFIGGSTAPALHELFQQQVRSVLDQSDLDEEGKQAILVAMNCPCCGAGGMNYTAKINRKGK